MKHTAHRLAFYFSLLTAAFCISANSDIYAQSGQEYLIEKGGTFDSWVTREIKESGIIGGNTKNIYSIGPESEVKGAVAYTPPAGWVWGCSNVLAIVKGVVKTSCSVFPEKRGRGYCARLETRMEDVRVAGLINMHVIASGTIFLGHMIEPIRNTRNPQSKWTCGIPFTGKPRAISFDYKVIVGNKRIKSTGFSSIKVIGDNDYADCTVLLQKRWEDKDGNVFALRVGTGAERFTRTENEWQNGHVLEIHYGNITDKSYYKSYMGLISSELSNYTINSKGKSVPVQEIGWASASERPTHIIIKFSSSYGEAYVGDISNRLWIDNVKIVE
ncbi:MAG: PCMD domain-containing protein [Bacteroidales bacterium]|jgi:hypothetical protein|nr:PCMD domain-containing protein [Bacteroidales bacterium]MCI1733959.1 PCMD domain-containing protein [Bacteroidales bacterium]